MIKVTGNRPGLLERFGLYYLGRFSSRQPHHHPFDQTDDELVRKVRTISRKGIFLSAIVGIVTVFPIVWLDLRFSNAGFWIHYGILAAAISASP